MKAVALLLVLVAACSPAKPRTPGTSSEARAQRVSIGALEAYALADAHLDIPNDGTLLGVGRPPSEISAVLAAAGLPRDTIRLDIQCLLIKTGDRVILFDTGVGEAAGGQLPQSLVLAKVAPIAVTDIFISHAHGDHVGGLVTKAGGLAFPTATIHISAPEWAAFQAETDADARRYVAVIAPKVMAFEPDARVLPMVKAVATPGHTVGHSSYEIGTGAATMFYLGDLAHHSVISVQRPAWSVQVDGDHAAAEAVRQATLAKRAADHVLVFATHFPFPGVGHVAAEGQSFVWKPEAL